jgi:hypothetical protein
MRAHVFADCSSAMAACAAGLSGTLQRSSSVKTTATCKHQVSEQSAAEEQQVRLHDS